MNKFCTTCLVLFAAFVSQLLTAPIHAQVNRSAHTYLGAKECVYCHSNRNTLTDWVDLDVVSIWRKDAHHESHYALDGKRNTRTAQIEKLLNINANTNKNCLACHGKQDGEPSASEENEFVHNGISCETCHGAASGYILDHKREDWRFKTSAEKASLGMVDLRNPVIKADKCLSCHLGSVSENKIVSHEMYAAGHPPLTSFEMETFGHAMPKHWRRLSEKSAKIQAAATQRKYTTEGSSESQRALLASLVALDNSVRLLGEQANNEKAIWPELSLYDCQACHHDLRVPSWRQEAGYGDLIPGRPSLHRWPQQLATVSLMSDRSASDLTKPLTILLNERPFGPRETLPAVVTSVSQTIQKEIEKIASPAWNSQHSREIVARLCDQGTVVADFESARQLVWVLLLSLPPAEATRLEKGFNELLATDIRAPGDPFWQRSLARERDYDPKNVRRVFEKFRTRLPSATATSGAPGRP